MSIKSIFSVLAFFAILLVQQACSPFTKVYAEAEPGTNYYRYRTFNWLDTQYIKKGNGGPDWLNAHTQGKIRSAVEGQLVRYGFAFCDNTPDLMLHFHVVIKNEVFYVPEWECDDESGMDYGHCHRLRQVNYQEGSLIIDFIDTKTNTQVWRGSASGVFDVVTPEQADVRIEEAVSLIFEKFPGSPVPKA